MGKSKNAGSHNRFNMTTAVDVNPSASDDAVLAGLLEQLEGDETETAVADTLQDEILEAAAEAADELIEQVATEAAETVASVNAEADDPLDALLEEVADDAARIEAKQELYASQEAAAPAEGGDAPATDPEAVTEKKGRKGKSKKAKKNERLKAAAGDAPTIEPEAAAEEKEPKVPKAPRPTSVTHKPGDLLLAKLGDKAKDYLVFDLDTLVSEEKFNEFIERMNDRDAIADKVREKIIMLATWMAKGAAPDALNEVLRRTFMVLHKDGMLTSGDKGNLQLNLLAKPYSMGTARSQANQMFMALPELGLTLKEKGKMVPNPDSIMLHAINKQLGLA